MVVSLGPWWVVCTDGLETLSTLKINTSFHLSVSRIHDVLGFCPIHLNHPQSLCCSASFNQLIIPGPVVGPTTSVFLLKEAGRSTKRCLALRRVFGHVCDKNMYY